ncbi:hypothetical protein D6764_00025 [Candidatus Woesearchaeota archaeon]|nr:MAG: hypothetical protein D6764_00025 [Candidatus Woesearchaeota archaeon]
MHRSKRGSLELSVNAIVVLVLAITMLGLGIAFTKGKFAELGAKIEIPEPDFPATEDQPIVMATNEITVSTTKDAVFTIKVYNDGSLGSTEVAPTVTCIFSGTNTVTTHTVPQAIPVGEDIGFKILVDAAPSTLSGEKGLCTIVVDDGAGNVYATKQFNMIVH